jgi:AcrR family transcriptional regulator
MSSPDPVSRRSDAERNRARVLDAARDALETADDVSMAEIARRAGVGMATLYRNFPDRRALLDTLYREEVDAVCAAADLAGGDAGGGFFVWVARFAEFVRGKRLIAAELLQHTGREDPVFGGSRDRVLVAARPLLVAAQADGSVRAGLSIEQVLDLVVSVLRIAQDAAYVDPILAAALDGLRVPSEVAD